MAQHSLQHEMKEPCTQTTGTTQLNLMTVREVAQYLQVSTRTVYRYIAQGKLPTYSIGNSTGTVRIARSDLHALLIRRTVENEVA